MLADSAFNVAVYKKIDQASRLAGFLMVNSISLALFVITKMFVPAYQSLQNTTVFFTCCPGFDQYNYISHGGGSYPPDRKGTLVGTKILFCGPALNFFHP